MDIPVPPTPREVAQRIHDALPPALLRYLTSKKPKRELVILGEQNASEIDLENNVEVVYEVVLANPKHVPGQYWNAEVVLALDDICEGALLKADGDLFLAQKRALLQGIKIKRLVQAGGNYRCMCQCVRVSVYDIMLMLWPFTLRR